MAINSIQHKDFFLVKDGESGNAFYGFDQEWYTTAWQRLAGCGPTVVANIVNYLNCSRIGRKLLPLTKKEALTLMEEVYQYVTPTPRGIPSTQLLYDNVLDYAENMGVNMQLEVLNVPEDWAVRPDFRQLISFLQKALLNDTPLAFLNLDNGAEKRLDSWHWVTIITLEHSESSNSAVISILDAGKIQKIDLAQWFHTTKLGGGFVSFDVSY